MSLKDQVTEDMKNAMRAKDTARLGTIRLLLSAMKQKEVDERVVLDDAAIVVILDKLMKQRKDSIAAFELAARQDLVDIEQAEMVVLPANWIFTAPMTLPMSPGPFAPKEVTMA